MALFSHRKGIRPLQKAVQREAIDEELRNRLWSALKLVIWDNHQSPDLVGRVSGDTRRVLMLVETIWLHHFKAPVDTIPGFRSGSQSAYAVLRKHFFEAEWWEVYDFLEFIAKNAGRPWGDHLAELCNKFLEDENAAYRFIDHEIAEITNEYEVAAVEDALDRSTKQHGSILLARLNFSPTERVRTTETRSRNPFPPLKLSVRRSPARQAVLWGSA